MYIFAFCFMPNHSDKIQAQLVAAALQKAGIKHIVISPGSRNAPLIIEFTGNGFFTSHSVVDERVAGFFALGVAQQLHQPVVLVCTSGSALLNYYPAIAEAFYSHIPLIVVSADRPQKWVDQGEGQTIRQHGVFANHSWFDTTLSEGVEVTDEDINGVKTAIETAFNKRGPVHINVPFSEPIYNQIAAATSFSLEIQTDVPDKIYEESFLDGFADMWNASKRKMILVGQHQASEFLQLQLEKFAQDPSVIVLNENISNVHNQRFINNIDRLIFPLQASDYQDLQPEILITVGRNIISKKVKQFLRTYAPKEHWHVEKTDLPPDTFEVLTQHFDTAPEMFFSQFLFLEKANHSADYQRTWLQIDQAHKQKHLDYLHQIPFCDLKIFESVCKTIPANYHVQWGNSSTVRYAQLFDFHPSIKHFSNRGTSGIDGSTSTAIGAAYAGKQPTLLITGDISFLYDSNALWNKYIPDNFKIIVVNNGGGDIFNFIPGPAKTTALSEFFVTRHNLDASHLATMYGLNYKRIDNLKDLETYLPEFFSQNKIPQLLEVDTQAINNAKVLKDYFAFLGKAK